MATFDGTNIFGRSSSVWVDDQPREDQEEGFPGLNGVVSLDLGSRGSFGHAKGVITGADSSLYVLAERLFRSYRDGNAYVLVDNFGRVFPQVKLLEFNVEPGPIRWDAYWKYFKPYTATFRVLTGEVY